MSHKRENARRAADEKRAARAQAAAEVRAAAEKRAAAARAADEKRATEARAAAEAAAERFKELDVVPWLRRLGFRADEARRAAARCEAIPEASLEERVRLALSFLCPRTASRDFRPAERRVGTAA